MTLDNNRTLIRHETSGAVVGSSAASPYGEYSAPDGSHYRYTVQGCDWDLDHPGACLLTFQVEGRGQSFEKVIAVDEKEAAPFSNLSAEDAVIRAAQRKLYAKLEAGNLADEPTPLR